MESDIRLSKIDPFLFEPLFISFCFSLLIKNPNHHPIMCPYVANVIIPCILKSILMRKTIRSKMCKNKKGTDCIHKIGHVYTKVELSMFPLL